MRTPSFLAKAPIDVPNRSGFAMPFEYMATGRCGTLYPVLCKPFVPNETVSLEIAFEAELPPMVSNFFGRVDLCFEAFWVPNYLLWKGWDKFAVHPTDNPIYPEGTPSASKPHAIPQILAGIQSKNKLIMGRNTLGDYLGFKSVADFTDSQTASPLSVSALPFLAYHRCYHDHYRNNVVQAPVFYEPDGSTVSAPYAATLPYVSGVNPSAPSDSRDNVRNINLASDAAAVSSILGDGVRLTDLRQANWDFDYFTAATPQPQAGTASTVTFDVSVDTTTGDGTGSFSISALRQMNAIQQWMERNNLVGYDYAEQTFVQYGVYPKRQLDKCVYLGRYSEPVYSRSVFQTSQSENESRNPFGGVAAKFGSSAANGKGLMFDNFKCTDHGFLVVLMSLRPYSYYSTGCDRSLVQKYIGDIPFPLLSSVGDQPIYNYELMGLGVDTPTTATANQVFGWIDQYAHAKTVNDSVHGELRDGGILDSFVLQRSFSPADGANTISDSFLEIPVDYLDQVKEVQNSLVPIDYWVSVYMNLNKLSPLPVYSVPTLGRLPNTHVETVSRKKSTI